MKRITFVTVAYSSETIISDPDNVVSLKKLEIR